MRPDRKAVRSKLDPFRDQLLALNDAGAKLAAIQEWLSSQGMKVSIATVSNFLTKVRTARARKAKENEPRSIEYFPEAKRLQEALKEAYEKSAWARRQRRKLRRKLRREQLKRLAQ